MKRNLSRTSWSPYWLSCLIVWLSVLVAEAQEPTHYVTIENIPYHEVIATKNSDAKIPENTNDASEVATDTTLDTAADAATNAVHKNDSTLDELLLDIYYPENTSAFTTLVWYHGGGLTGGHKHIPESLKEKGIAIVAVEYRLSPAVDFPVFIEDAAAAAVWVKRHIAEYGGDANRVFLAGGSAGGYLTAMIGMDPRWLKPYGMSSHDFAGLIPVSAQVTTHFHVKKLLGDQGEQYQPVIDQNAPLAHLSKTLPPILLIVGDRKVEWKARVEENELMYASLKALGHLQVFFHENMGFDHGISGLGRDCEEPAQQILDFMTSIR